MVAIPESGSLKDLPFPRLLLDVHRARLDGVLRMSRERAEKTFVFQEGVPIFAESNLASETLGVQLLDRGDITREEHQQVSSHMKRKRCREGTALLELGLLEPKALFVALKDQVRHRVLDCFGWTHGKFTVEPTDAPPEKAQPFRADLYALIQEGIEVHWNPERVLQDLAPNMEKCVKRTRRVSRVQDRLLWDDCVTEFIDALDGTRTLWRALQRAKTPRCLAAAWLLDAVGALEYPERIASSDPDAEAAVEIVLTDAVVEEEAAAAETSGPSPDDSGVDVVLTQEIQEKFARLAELDHYELLGLASDTPAQAIRGAYLDAAKRYHPDALARAGVDDETRQCAGKVFAAIGRAHAVLSNPNSRRDYDSALGSDDTDLDAERLAAAETNYRKAEILMRVGNFQGALEYLRPAVDLWPEEPVYHAALGWSLFKKKPSELEEGRAHLERALELDGRSAQTAYWLSIVVKQAGETVAAANLMARAREIDPDI
jgi:tetratricopeptide (TPR) repeat protein